MNHQQKKKTLDQSLIEEKYFNSYDITRRNNIMNNFDIPKKIFSFIEKDCYPMSLKHQENYYKLITEIKFEKLAKTIEDIDCLINLYKQEIDHHEQFSYADNFHENQKTTMKKQVVVLEGIKIELAKLDGGI